MANKIRLVAPAAILAAVVYYLDYLVFAPPIIAMTVWLGPWAAFIILTPFYLVFDYFLGTITLRIVQKDRPIKYNGFLRTLLRLIDRWFGVYKNILPNIEKRLSAKTGLIIRSFGFVFASYWGTAFLTMPAMYLLGQRRHLHLLTFLSASIYAVTFVAQTAGLTLLGVKLFKLIVNAP